MKSGGDIDYKSIDLSDMHDLNTSEIKWIKYHPLEFTENLDDVQRCKPHDAELWGLYFTMKGNYNHCFARCPDEETALHFAYAFGQLLNVEIK